MKLVTFGVLFNIYIKLLGEVNPLSLIKDIVEASIQRLEVVSDWIGTKRLKLNSRKMKMLLIQKLG